VFLFVSVSALSAKICIGQTNPVTMSKPFMSKDSVAKKKPVTDTLDTSAANSVNADSIALALKPHPFQPNPKKAGLYSSIVPGLGQLYNREYWKIPVVYAGAAIAAYFISKNLKQYQSYRLAYINRINNPNFVDKYTGIYQETQLQQLQNDYNKYLDLSVLFTGLGYALQVLDAVTSAHLKNFEISRDISIHMRPVVAPPYGIGMGLVMNY
jgi:hypothetical protein